MSRLGVSCTMWRWSLSFGLYPMLAGKCVLYVVKCIVMCVYSEVYSDVCMLAGKCVLRVQCDLC